MATYKIIQDIEAEDHILGPLSLRQFIFALAAVFCYYICFLLITKNAAFLLILFLPPAIFFSFFAFPFGRDQPTEIWALAKIRYYLLPRKRIWNQTGLKEFVTINVPKKVVVERTNGLSQTEVNSRLKVLASTIDSRGWATKNVGTDVSPASAVVSDDSDRLIGLSAVPREARVEDQINDTDMMDPVSSPIAQQFDQLISQSTTQRHEQLVDMVNSPIDPHPVVPSSSNSNWFMSSLPQQGPPISQRPVEPAVAVGPNIATAQEPSLEEEQEIKDIMSRQGGPSSSMAHLRTLQPLSDQPKQQPLAPTPTATPFKIENPSDSQHDADIINLSRTNDRSVSSLAHEIHQDRGEDDNEVIISLH